MEAESEITGFLIISMGRITGTLLLAVYHYSSTSNITIISKSALGVLLIVLAFILAYSGIQKNFSKESLVVTFCMTVSALWFNTGIINLLLDYGIVNSTEKFQNAMLPGLAALSLAFLIMACVGTLRKEGPLTLMAFALALANIHVIALFHDAKIGSSATACNFMIVTIISIYLVVIRLISLIKGNRTVSRDNMETTISKIPKKQTLNNHLVVTGMISNMVSSSVFIGKLLRINTVLFIGQVPWLWTSAVYQVVVTFISFRSGDILYATFFSFTAFLKFAEGYSLLYPYHQSDEPFLPLPFTVVFAILFLSLGLMTSLQKLWDGIYILLFASYCIALCCCPSGTTHYVPQKINTAIFLASAVLAFAKLYISTADVKKPPGKWVTGKIFSHIGPLKIRQGSQPRGFCFTMYTNVDIDVIGHAFNTLVVFSITKETSATIPLLVAAGSMVLISGFLSLSSGKTLESSAFMFYGIVWIVWGVIKYEASQGAVRGFNIAVLIICFLLLNSFLIICMLVLNKAWFLNTLTLQVLLLNFLLNALNILSAAYNIAASILFGVVSFYCFLTALFNSIVESPHLPWGRPFIKQEWLQLMSSRLYPLSAGKVTSIKKIADIMNAGGVCVIPTDVSYVIAAACHCADSVQKISQIPVESTDKEISFFISNLGQLEPVKYLLSPMVWDFIEGLWPHPIGVVLSKQGSWLNSLGLTSSLSSSLDHCSNVTLYISDCAVTNSLTDLVGPLAVRSLGKEKQVVPGQMCTRLLAQVDGILLEKPNTKKCEFTVVDCTQIHCGFIKILKSGSVSTAQVMDIWHAVIIKRADCANVQTTVRL